MGSCMIYVSLRQTCLDCKWMNLKWPITWSLAIDMSVDQPIDSYRTNMHLPSTWSWARSNVVVSLTSTIFRSGVTQAKTWMVYNYSISWCKRLLENCLQLRRGNYNESKTKTKEQTREEWWTSLKDAKNGKRGKID